MLPGVPEVQAAAAEIVGSLSPGACWLDMSTASPAAARRIAELAERRRVGALEAPVGGGPEQARDGQLLAFVGGRSEELVRCRPVLEALCGEVLHVGPVGAGYTVKLLVNLLWFGQAVATAEALALPGGGPRPRRRPRRARAQRGRQSLPRRPRRPAARRRQPAGVPAGALLRGARLGPGARRRKRGGPRRGHGRLRDVPRALEHFGDVDGELLGARADSRPRRHRADPPPEAGVEGGRRGCGYPPSQRRYSVWAIPNWSRIRPATWSTRSPTVPGRW